MEGWGWGTQPEMTLRKDTSHQRTYMVEGGRANSHILSPDLHDCTSAHKRVNKQLYSFFICKKVNRWLKIYQRQDLTSSRSLQPACSCAWNYQATGTQQMIPCGINLLV